MDHQTYLRIEQVRIKVRELKEARESLSSLDQPRILGEHMVEGLKSRLGDLIDQITRARTEAPKLRRRARHLGHVTRQRPGTARSRRGRRLALLRQASRLEEEASAAAEALGVSTEAPKEVLVEAGRDLVSELEAMISATKAERRTQKHRAWQAHRRLEEAVDTLVENSGHGVSRLGLADMGVPSSALW